MTYYVIDHVNYKKPAVLKIKFCFFTAVLITMDFFFLLFVHRDKHKINKNVSPNQAADRCKSVLEVRGSLDFFPIRRDLTRKTTPREQVQLAERKGTYQNLVFIYNC